jgi:hypothetical protein
MFKPSVAAIVVLSLVSSGVVFAESKDDVGSTPMGHGVCGTVPTATLGPVAGVAGGVRAVSHTLFVNRCVGGCSVTGSTIASAPNNQSAVQGLTVGQVYDIPEFTNKAGETGAAADAEWQAIMACVTETESYYNITVVDQRPASGSYHMAVVGGTDDDIGISTGQGQLLGISQLDRACSPIDNVVSFVLAESHRPFAASSDAYIRDVCKTIVHEAGHAFGLEHTWAWVDDQTSACQDPMSYDTQTCDPSPAYFRKRIASCGGFEQMQCLCNGSTNSHERMLSAFGPGTPTVPPGNAAITFPAANGVLGAVIAASAGTKRGIDRVELYLNGWKWLELPGAAYTRGGGQPNPSPYQFTVPQNIPDGVYDIEIRAYDDLGTVVTATSTATKGAPCQSADSCLGGQKCDAGKCYWAQPAGEIGDTCTYNEFCKSNLCAGPADASICTTSCIPLIAESCPADSGLTCVETSPGKGVCVLEDEGGGCCRVGGDSSETWARVLLSLGVVGSLLLRRRPR